MICSMIVLCVLIFFFKWHSFVIYSHLLVCFFYKVSSMPRDPIQNFGLNEGFLEKYLQCLRFYVFFSWCLKSTSDLDKKFQLKFNMAYPKCWTFWNMTTWLTRYSTLFILYMPYQSITSGLLKALSGEGCWRGKV